MDSSTSELKSISTRRNPLRLPFEIQEQIILECSDQATLAVLCRVSKDFLSKAGPRLYLEIEIDSLEAFKRFFKQSATRLPPTNPFSSHLSYTQLRTLHLSIPTNLSTAPAQAILPSLPSSNEIHRLLTNLDLPYPLPLANLLLTVYSTNHKILELYFERLLHHLDPINLEIVALPLGRPPLITQLGIPFTVNDDLPPAGYHSLSNWKHLQSVLLRGIFPVSADPYDRHSHLSFLAFRSKRLLPPEAPLFSIPSLRLTLDFRTKVKTWGLRGGAGGALCQDAWEVPMKLKQLGVLGMSEIGNEQIRLLVEDEEDVRMVWKGAEESMKDVKERGKLNVEMG
ncbi:hypothetical protein BDY24DRAFT_82991 [Mrakia frigida]|uniref:uncharacterized protein n=1 Tax=Mrakia frigida TaxID=29902 RepID=UPI003FCC15A2